MNFPICNCSVGLKEEPTQATNVCLKQECTSIYGRFSCNKCNFGHKTQCGEGNCMDQEKFLNFLKKVNGQKQEINSRNKQFKRILDLVSSILDQYQVQQNLDEFIASLICLEKELPQITMNDMNIMEEEEEEEVKQSDQEIHGNQHQIQSIQNGQWSSQYEDASTCVYYKLSFDQLKRFMKIYHIQFLDIKNQQLELIQLEEKKKHCKILKVERKVEQKIQFCQNVDEVPQVIEEQQTCTKPKNSDTCQKFIHFLLGSAVSVNQLVRFLFEQDSDMDIYHNISFPIISIESSQTIDRQNIVELLQKAQQLFLSRESSISLSEFVGNPETMIQELQQLYN